MRPAYLKVMIDGDDIHGRSPDAILEEARIDYSINDHARCRLHYRQTPDRRFPVEDFIGRDLRVVAVDSAGAELDLFAGEVTEVELGFDISGAYNLRLDAASRTLRMDLTPRHRSYPQASCEDHLKRALGYSGLSLVLDSSSPVLASEGGILQIGETDFEFVRRLVDLAGCVFRATRDGIQVLDRFLDAGCSVEWRAEGGLLDFRLVGRLAPFEYDGWVYDRSSSVSYVDTRTMSPPGFGPAAGLIGAAEDASKKNQWRGELIDPLLARTQEGLEATVDLEAKRAALSRVYALGVSREARILPAQKLTINGPIEAAGDWGVLSVVHHWRHDGYSNEFIASPFTQPLQWKRPVRRPWSGLLVARVVEVGKQDREEMVQVQFPWAEEEPWLWVPVAAPNAGPERGIYFRPEVGDEVLIGFEFGDTNRPVLVASLWNGAHRPPSADVYGDEYSTNDIKRIVTKSGNRVVFDDKEGSETIVMATPHHVRVSLFDGGSRLLLHSDGDIHIHAGGTVHVRCKQFLREVG